LDFRSAPPSTSSFTTASCPLSAAHHSGVRPYLSLHSRSPPLDEQPHHHRVPVPRRPCQRRLAIITASHRKNICDMLLDHPHETGWHARISAKHAVPIPIPSPEVTSKATGRHQGLAVHPTSLCMRPNQKSLARHGSARLEVLPSHLAPDGRFRRLVHRNDWLT
jgi:hypothetical protein